MNNKLLEEIIGAAITEGALHTHDPLRIFRGNVKSVRIVNEIKTEKEEENMFKKFWYSIAEWAIDENGTHVELEYGMDEYLTTAEQKDVRYRRLSLEEARKRVDERRRKKEAAERMKYETMSQEIQKAFDEMIKEERAKQKAIIENFFSGKIILDTCIWETANENQAFFAMLKGYLAESGNKITILADIYQEFEVHASSDNPEEAARGRSAKRIVEDFINENLVVIDDEAFSGRYRQYGAYADPAINNFALDCACRNIPCTIFTEDRALRSRITNRLNQQNNINRTIVKVIGWQRLAMHS